MKSPIKDLVHRNNCTALLKELIPPGSTINSYLFYAGQTEFNLAESNRFVIGHTNSFPVYEFWRCLSQDSQRLHKIVSADIFKFGAPEMFSILQETWATYPDPFMRAALFFLLNSCSETGRISSGALNSKNYHPLSLSYVQAFRDLPTFHLNYEREKDWLKGVSGENVDFVYIPAGIFSYGLFSHGKSLGFEETAVNHRQLRARLRQLTCKWVVTYNYHKALPQHYKDFSLVMVDQYGNVTNTASTCTEILIKNF